MEDRFRVRLWDITKQKFIKVTEIDYCTDGEEVTVYYDGDTFETVLDEEYLKACFLEQCTGLKDKNGKLIYEGDIVKYHVIKKSSFPIEREVLAFKTKKVTFKKGYFSPIFNLDLNDVEIIGNIHENSELLEDNNVKHSE